MSKRLTLSTLAVGLAAFMTAVSLAPTAVALDDSKTIGADDPLPPAAVNNPDIPLEIIAALPEVIQNDPDVFIDPEIDLGPIVYPDGTPVEGQSARMTAAAWYCGGTAEAAVLGTWGLESVGDCSVWGSVGKVQGYAWAASDPTKSVCVQVRGFNGLGQRTWYSGSCGFSNPGVGVPWGNVLSHPSLRAKSNAVLLSNSVGWHI